MLSGAKHPREPSYPAPLRAFDEILQLHLSPTPRWSRVDEFLRLRFSLTL
jgi:hypothetical protein